MYTHILYDWMKMKVTDLYFIKCDSCAYFDEFVGGDAVCLAQYSKK